MAVTLSLLLVAKKMARHRVLVKELSTIETLSCVNVIASDKTGTLTQNKMFVSNILTGKIETQKSPNYDEKTTAFSQLIALSGLCNDACCQFGKVKCQFYSLCFKEIVEVCEASFFHTFTWHVQRLYGSKN